MSNTEKPYFLEKLQSDYLRRQRANRAYSLRAFARQLNIQPPTLSAILNRKRPLPKQRAMDIAKLLSLSPTEHHEFVLSAVGIARDTKPETHRQTQRLLEEEAHFKIISEWEHYAVLTLFDTIGFRPTEINFKNRLKVSSLRIKSVLSNLVRVGLIEFQQGRYVRNVTDVKTTEDIISPALRIAHGEALDMGKEKLESVSVEKRDFSSVTVAIDVSKLPEAKVLIRDFRKAMMRLAKSGQPKEVYQLCIQFYPLTGGT